MEANQPRRLRWAGHVAKMKDGTATGKKLLGRPRRRWEVNIRLNLKEIGINTMNWVDLAHDRDY